MVLPLRSRQRCSRHYWMRGRSARECGGRFLGRTGRSIAIACSTGNARQVEPGGW